MLVLISENAIFFGQEKQIHHAAAGAVGRDVHGKLLCVRISGFSGGIAIGHAPHFKDTFHGKLFITNCLRHFDPDFPPARPHHGLALVNPRWPGATLDFAGFLKFDLYVREIGALIQTLLFGLFGKHCLFETRKSFRRTLLQSLCPGLGTKIFQFIAKMNCVTVCKNIQIALLQGKRNPGFFALGFGDAGSSRAITEIAPVNYINRPPGFDVSLLVAQNLIGAVKLPQQPHLAVVIFQRNAREEIIIIDGAYHLVFGENPWMVFIRLGICNAKS